MAKSKKHHVLKLQESKSTKQGDMVLDILSRDTGVPVDVLRTFAGISELANAHIFTAKAARKAFAQVQVK